MEGNTESVRFISYMLQDLKSLRVTINKQRIRIPYSDYLLQPFCQTDNSQLLCQSQFGQCLISKIQLSFPTVDHHQLRQVVRILPKHPRISPVDHFLHGSIVIGPDYSLYLELSVIFLGRNTVPEHYTGSHRVGTLNIGVIETLHVDRRFLHP